MALINCNFFSDVLGIASTMIVILPERANGQIGMQGSTAEGDIPTLYLLHGLSDDHTIWQRRTSIERYVAPLGLAVVMVSVNRSFYTDMNVGYDYFKFITEEVPQKAREFFRLSAKREDNYVAGLSMGGYGAFKIALTYPERYAFAASLSGAVDLFAMPVTELRDEFKAIFGDDPDTYKGSQNDIRKLIADLESSDSPKPTLYQCCGTEDFLYAQNTAIRDILDKTNIPHVYEEEPGTHEWGYWDTKIQRVLEMLPIGR